MLYTVYFSLSSACSVLQQLFGWCVICVIRPSLFTTQQVSKCLFDFKGFLCFMWEGVYISPQTALHRGVQYTSCPVHPPTPVFWHLSRDLVYPESPRRLTAVWVSIYMFCLIFRLPSSGWEMDSRGWHVIHLYQWLGPAGRASDQTTSFLCL